MFRRLLIFACFAYLLVAFGFTLLALLNASAIDDTVFIAEADAQVVALMSLVGLGVTMILGVRILIDGRYRQELERRALVPRRKSDIAHHDLPVGKV